MIPNQIHLCATLPDVEIGSITTFGTWAAHKKYAMRLTRRSPSGFSLIEITIVVAIVGIVAMIAVPRYANSIARYRIEAAARRIVGDIEYGRQHARSTSTSTMVHFEAGAHIVRLIGVPGMDDSSVEYQTRLGEAPYNLAIDSVDFGGDDRIVFDGYGMPDSGGFVQIAIGSELRKVSVDADSGEATIQ